MKCDAGEIACAIDRLTDAVRASSADPGISVFDWITRLVVPVFLGLLTLYVAVGSQRIAKQSNELATSVRRDSLERASAEERKEFGAQLEAWIAGRTEQVILTGATRPQGDVWNQLVQISLLATKVTSPGAVAMLLEVAHFFEDVLGVDRKTRTQPALFAKSMAEFTVRLWVKSPEESISLREEREFQDADNGPAGTPS